MPVEVAAALDLGSNTLRLLVAEAGPEGYRSLARELATPRLGQGLAPGAKLAREARQLAREQTGRFAAQARELGATRVFLAATQACRVAADGAELVAFLGREFKLDSARVLNGEEEARLSRLGVLSRLKGPAQGALLADVGGGSTELTPLDGQEAPPKALSLPVGAVSLTEAYIRTDPPAAPELAALKAAAAQGLEAAAKLAGAKRLVATAGTAASLASIRQGLTAYLPERLDNFQASREEIAAEFDRLAALDLKRRRQIPGLEPERADIILAGLAILQSLLDALGLTRLTTMNAGLLEGILIDGLANDHTRSDL